MLDGVDDQVAQHPLDPPGVGLGDRPAAASPTHPDPGALALGERLGPVDDPAHDVAQVDRLGLQHRGARVEPADLQQVGEQRLEPVELVRRAARRSARSTGSKSSRASWMTSAAIRTVVSGVRSSCETSETNRRCIRDSSSSCWIFSWRFCAILLKASPSRAMSSSPLTFIRSWSRPADSRSAIPAAIRTGVTTCRATSQAIAAEQHDDEQPGGRQGALDQVERLLLLREREEVVQLVRVAVGVVEPACR